MTMNTLHELKQFMREKLTDECTRLFGLAGGLWIDRAVDNWFDDSQNYDRRWRVINLRRPNVGRVLDVAAGCGTFMLYGLRNGRDVTGIEPERWKRTYYRQKIELSGYDPTFSSRLVPAVGEALPFDDNSFDLVTTFQTLEHVNDVRQCIAEMVRVLRPGGVLYLRAPDYNCFFEPHYRLPFLPKMPRSLAEPYLRWMGKPLQGLATLNWTTERDVIAALRALPGDLSIERTKEFFIDKNREDIDATLSQPLRKLGLACVLNQSQQLKRQAIAWLNCFRQERVIDLWVTKRPSARLRCAA
jgi:ubiquinone/menaquinone biosynthesis C-methylase UbiE